MIPAVINKNRECIYFHLQSRSIRRFQKINKFRLLIIEIAEKVRSSVDKSLDNQQRRPPLRRDKLNPAPAPDLGRARVEVRGLSPGRMEIINNLCLYF